MTADKQGGSVERVYRAVLEMAVSFRLKPGERVNEVALAREFNTSRTPLREALNRLVSEGFLRFERGRGFFCRTFQPRDVFELYQVRLALETFAVRTACAEAADADIEALERLLDETGISDHNRRTEELLSLDERFHEAIMGLTGNSEMLRMLRNVNARIRYFRWVDMEVRRRRTQEQHRAIVAAIASRDPDSAAQAMSDHIERRREEATQTIKEGLSRLYLEGTDAIPEFTMEIAE